MLVSVNMAILMLMFVSTVGMRAILSMGMLSMEECAICLMAVVHTIIRNMIGRFLLQFIHTHPKMSVGNER